MSDKPWPEGAQPTVAEAAEWLQSQSQDEREKFVAWALGMGEIAGRCFEQDHEGLMHEVKHLRQSHATAYEQGWKDAIAAVDEQIATRP